MARLFCVAALSTAASAVKLYDADEATDVRRAANFNTAQTFLARSPGSEEQSNLYGESLQECPRHAFMEKQPPDKNDLHFPYTGYGRGDGGYNSDRCAAMHGDEGSHFVCVNLPEGEGEYHSSFWVDTEQSENGASAHDDSPWPGPWCICEWAFGRMIMNPIGAAENGLWKFHKYLKCESVHQLVVQSYEKNKYWKPLAAVCAACHNEDKPIEQCKQEKWTTLNKLDPDGFGKQGWKADLYQSDDGPSTAWFEDEGFTVAQQKEQLSKRKVDNLVSHDKKGGKVSRKQDKAVEDKTVETSTTAAPAAKSSATRPFVWAIAISSAVLLK